MFNGNDVINLMGEETESFRSATVLAAKSRPLTHSLTDRFWDATHERFKDSSARALSRLTHSSNTRS